MLEKYGVSCDECGTYHHLSSAVFSHKIQEIKDGGWQIKKVFTMWRHYCPDCKTPKAPPPVRKELWYDRF